MQFFSQSSVLQVCAAILNANSNFRMFLLFWFLQNNTRHLGDRSPGASEANHYPGACSFTLGVLAPGRDMGHFPKSVCARVLGNSRDPPPGLGLPRDLARRELKKPSARGFSRLQPPASEPLPVKNMHPPARFQHQRQRPGSLPCSLLHQNSLRIMAAHSCIVKRRTVGGCILPPQ